MQYLPDTPSCPSSEFLTSSEASLRLLNVNTITCTNSLHYYMNPLPAHPTRSQSDHLTRTANLTSNFIAQNNKILTLATNIAITTQSIGFFFWVEILVLESLEYMTSNSFKIGDAILSKCYLLLHPCWVSRVCLVVRLTPSLECWEWVLNPTRGTLNWDEEWSFWHVILLTFRR